MKRKTNIWFRIKHVLAIRINVVYDLTYGVCAYEYKYAEVTSQGKREKYNDTIIESQNEIYQFLYGVK